MVVKPIDVDAHAAACSKIYSYYVANSTCTFEESPPDLAPRLREVVDAGLPAVVAIDGTEIIGYAYCARWSPRSAYRYTLTPSCYVHNSHHRKGAGRAMMQALIESARTGGFRHLISVVGDEENLPSIHMHEALGTSYKSRLPFHMSFLQGRDNDGSDCAGCGLCVCLSLTGFRHVGTFRDVGFKFDKWLSTIYFQMDLTRSE